MANKEIKEIRERGNWQTEGGKNAIDAENLFLNVFNDHFTTSGFIIRKSPKEFNKIYVDFPLNKSVQEEIYNPVEPVTKHGITPDFAIENTKNGKTLYIEVKRQDGWSEKTTRAQGRGNAHERCCKYFTPGLLKILREVGGINEGLPFWIVFMGDITRDPCRVREITCWFDVHTAHFFFWRDVKNIKQIINHFDQNLKHLLD